MKESNLSTPRYNIRRGNMQRLNLYLIATVPYIKNIITYLLGLDSSSELSE